MTEQILAVVTYAAIGYKWLIFLSILASWIPSFKESSFMVMVDKLVDPYLAIFRKVIPPLGVIDISPIVAIIAYNFLIVYALDGFEAFLDIIANMF